MVVISVKGSRQTGKALTVEMLPKVNPIFFFFFFDIEEFIKLYSLPLLPLLDGWVCPDAEAFSDLY